MLEHGLGSSQFLLGLRCLGLVAVCYVSFKLYQQITLTYRARKNPHFKQLPSSPRHWFWGNLINDGQKIAPTTNRHPDYGFEEIYHTLEEPPVFMVDLLPISFSLLVVADPRVAEQLTEPCKEYKYSVPKSDTIRSLWPLMGKESIVTAEGETWRALRRRFNKGFAPQHLHSLTPLVVQKMSVFVSRLKDRAKTGDAFTLLNLAMDLTTDIVTELAMGYDLQAQSTANGEKEKATLGILTASRSLTPLIFKMGQGIGFHNIDPIRPIKSWFWETVFDWKLSKIISRQLKGQSEGAEGKAASRAITTLAAEEMAVDSALIQTTVSQVKTFLFAGQDTTASTLSWIVYELSKASHDANNAAIKEELIAEHNSVFGPELFSALDVLAIPGQAETILDKLPYTNAYVKEVLRIHPPSGSARMIPEVSSSTPEFRIKFNDKSVAINGMRIYIDQWLIHRNKAIWGEDALVFKPERWLNKAYVERLPAGAWRPFERGPRNCIGQTLALMEAVIMCCAVARGLEFEKVGLTGRNGEEEVWAGHRVTSVPIDGMNVRIKLQNED